MFYATSATYPYKPPNFQDTLNRLYSTANTSTRSILFFFTIGIFVYSAQQFNCWIEIRVHYWPNVEVTASQSGCEISGIRRIKCEVFALLVRHPGLVGICLPTFRLSRNVGKQMLYDNPEERRSQMDLSLATYKQSSVREEGLMVHGSVWS
jgi:hypothetical protein